jgi:hypothetical protein
LADRTELNVATASTSVPPAVASDEIDTQSIGADGRCGPPPMKGTATAKLEILLTLIAFGPLGPASSS